METRMEMFHVKHFRFFRAFSFFAAFAIERKQSMVYNQNDLKIK